MLNFISIRSGVLILWGSNFWLSHRKEKSPLTQGLNYRSACDDAVFTLSRVRGKQRRHQNSRNRRRRQCPTCLCIWPPNDLHAASDLQRVSRLQQSHRHPVSEWLRRVAFWSVDTLFTKLQHLVVSVDLLSGLPLLFFALCTYSAILLLSRKYAKWSHCHCHCRNFWVAVLILPRVHLQATLSKMLT